MPPLLISKGSQRVKLLRSSAIGQSIIPQIFPRAFFFGHPKFLQVSIARRGRANASCRFGADFSITAHTMLYHYTGLSSFISEEKFSLSLTAALTLARSRFNDFFSSLREKKIASSRERSLVSESPRIKRSKSRRKLVATKWWLNLTFFARTRFGHRAVICDDDEEWCN